MSGRRATSPAAGRSDSHAQNFRTPAAPLGGQKYLAVRGLAYYQWPRYRPRKQGKLRMSESAAAAALPARHGEEHEGHHDDHHHGHGDHGHGPIEYPVDEQFGKATPGKIAMWFFLCSDGFSFSGLLLAYGILRGASTRWHNPGEPTLGINFTAGLTFLLICSSVTMVLAYAAAVERNKKALCTYLALTILGGLLFLTGQY